MKARVSDDTILDAAEYEFARRGFHDTVVSEIADRAGVGKGTVYRRFGNKARLFGAIIQRGTEDLRARIEDVLQDRQDPERTLERLLRVHFDLYAQSGELIEIIVNEGLEMTGAVQEELLVEWERFQARFAEVFRRGIREGRFRDADPERLGFLFHSYIWSVLRGAIVFDRPLPREPSVKLMMQVFLDGIRAENLHPEASR